MEKYFTVRLSFCCFLEPEKETHLGWNRWFNCFVQCVAESEIIEDEYPPTSIHGEEEEEEVENKEEYDDPEDEEPMFVEYPNEENEEEIRHSSVYYSSEVVHKLNPILKRALDPFEVSEEGELILKSNNDECQCEKCGKVYNCLMSLSRHKTHCPNGRAFENDHMEDAEAVLDGTEEIDDKSKKKSCKDSLISHKPRFRELHKYETKDGVYSCWDCGKSYLWASSLSRHRSIECGPKNKKRFVCAMCNYRTGYKSNFIRHLKAPRHLFNSTNEKKRRQGATTERKYVREGLVEAVESREEIADNVKAKNTHEKDETPKAIDLQLYDS